MSQIKKHTITAALPYANGPVHIGHLAGVYVPADIYARFLRNMGKDVLFVCGSDEHGVPITLKAKKEGKHPQEIVDEYHFLIKNSFSDFGISFDHYSRTSSETHHQTAADFFLDLYNQGVFEELETQQYYDEQEQLFLADRYLTGECPNCGNKDIYRDQCESCGANIPNPTDLNNVKSTLSGNQPILKNTKHWYLPFDTDFLTNWLLKENQHWKTNVTGQVKSWLDAGLRPRAVTRDLDWGVKVPLDHAKDKVLYVWFDAPIGYISATKEWAEQHQKNWEDYWTNNAELVHFIGKDNIVFHCLIFPQMLKSNQTNFVLPSNVPANEFLNLEDKKISTSNNWAVWLHEYLQEFPQQQDALRYTLTANMPETKDNNFTWKDFQTKNNSELVGILGNFVNRVVVLTQKYYNGQIPEQSLADDAINQEINQHKQGIINHLSEFRFRDALTDYMKIARLGNKFLQETEPWKLHKTNPEQVAPIMRTAIEILMHLAQVTEPFLPITHQKLKQMLNLDSFGDFGKELPKLNQHTINNNTLLFSKIEDDQIQQQINKLQDTQHTNNATTTNMKPQKQECSFDDFQKIDLRIGTILEAKKVEKTDRLLELKVDTGIDTRTIVSGIANSFTPNQLIGKQAMVLVNLAPKKIKGIHSQGMLLLTEKPDGSLCLVSPEQTTNNGNTID